MIDFKVCAASLLLATAPVAVLAAPQSSTPAPAQAAPQAQVAQLMDKLLADYPGKEVVVSTVTYPPGAVDPVHRHDAHVFVYVLEGRVEMGLRGGRTVTLGPGQTFYEGPDDVHTVGRNASRSAPAKFLVFMLKDRGAPLLTPVP